MEGWKDGRIELTQRNQQQKDGRGVVDKTGKGQPRDSQGKEEEGVSAMTL